MVQALLANADVLDIAETVEQGKGVSLFQHPFLVIGPRRGGEYVPLVVDADNVVHTEPYESRAAARSRVRRPAAAGGG